MDACRWSLPFPRVSLSHKISQQERVAREHITNHSSALSPLPSKQCRPASRHSKCLGKGTCWAAFFNTAGALCAGALNVLHP